MKTKEKSLTINEIEVFVECPKCGKKSVVQRGEDVYQCLACDFVRDFSKPSKPEQKTDLLWPVVIIVVLTTFLLMLAQQNRWENEPDPATEQQSLSVSVEVLS